MSDADTQDERILGKRGRDHEGQDGEPTPDGSNGKQMKMEEDESDDDDVGPMPLPASEAISTKKKKRKGKVLPHLRCCQALKTCLTEEPTCCIFGFAIF